VPDPGLRTPLLDLFRRGDVARDIRLEAAQGGMAPRAHEQVALLMLLVDDADAEITAAAEATISMIPRAALEAFLARSDASTEMREFFASRGIRAATVAAQEADSPLVAVNAADDEVAAIVAVDDEGPERHVRESTVQKIASLNVAQRMTLAMKGSREERAVLVRDPNKIVAVAVLSSPKLTETEVESIAKMANVSDEILRMIGFSRAWTKNYTVVHALVRNPKTPVAISMNLLSRLGDRDLRNLSTNRNIPDVLRVSARKRVVIEK
jgi:predicted component of type VI protein secretion system